MTNDDQRWFAFVHYDGPKRRRRKEKVFKSYAQARDWHDRVTAETNSVGASGLLPERARS